MANAAVMPELRAETSQVRPARAVVLPVRESSSGGAGLGASAVAATEALLASANLVVVDARLVRQLEQRLALAELSGRVGDAGPRVADFVLRVGLLSASTTTRPIPAVEIRGADGRLHQIAARRGLHARVQLMLRMYDASNLRLLGAWPAEGAAARQDLSGPASAAESAQLLGDAVSDAIRQVAGHVLVALQPPAFVSERRVQGARSIFRVLTSSPQRASVGNLVQILSDRPPVDSPGLVHEVEPVVVAHGRVVNPAGDGYWVLVDDSRQAEAVRRGDRVRQLPDEGGLAGLFGQSFGAAAGVMGSVLGQPLSVRVPTRVPVLFGTNRVKTGRNAAQAYFGASESPAAFEQRLSLGRVSVSVPPKRRPGEIPRPAALWVALESLSTSAPANMMGIRPRVAADPQRHFSLTGPIEEFDEASFAALLKRSVAASRTKSALVYVHGFANSFEDAAFRAAQFSHDLADEGYDVVPVMFSWPSDPSGYNYGAAGGRIWSAGKQLAMFLRQLTATTGAGVVHLVGHSQGAQVLGQALDELRLDGLQALGSDGNTPVPRFREIILAAPDIRATDFRAIVLPAVRSGHSVTNYVSSNDAALRLSGRVNEDTRAGDAVESGMLVEGVRTIDVTAVNAEPIGHSSFADSPRVIADIRAQLLGRGPEERRLHQVQRGALRYWLMSD